MKKTLPPLFKRLILRAVLNDVSPIVARVFSIPDDVEITDLHDVFLSMLGWQPNLGFIIRVYTNTLLCPSISPLAELIYL